MVHIFRQYSLFLSVEDDLNYFYHLKLIIFILETGWKNGVPTMPQGITEECVKFVTNFMPQSIPRLQEGLTHDENWKEGDNNLMKSR